MRVTSIFPVCKVRLKGQPRVIVLGSRAEARVGCINSEAAIGVREYFYNSNYGNPVGVRVNWRSWRPSPSSPRVHREHERIYSSEHPKHGPRSAEFKPVSSFCSSVSVSETDRELTRVKRAGSKGERKISPRVLGIRI